MGNAAQQAFDDYSPEEAVLKIRADRRRNALVALTLALLGAIGFFVGIYLSYNEVPAPKGPANANPPVRLNSP